MTLCCLSDVARAGLLENGKNRWCLDSGATSHMVCYLSDFKNINKNHSRGRLNLANSSSTEISACGIVAFTADT